MKKFTLSVVAVMAMSTFAVAETFPAYGPDSYKESRDTGSNVDGGSNRKGFRLGLGIGAGGLSFDDYDYNEKGMATSFEIGYAFTNQVSLNYLNNVSWTDGDVGGFTGVSVNYYLNDAPDTPYVVAGIGFSSTDAISSSDIGGGFLLGVGYAIDNIEIEADFTFGQVDTYYGDDDMKTFQITVSYLFY